MFQIYAIIGTFLSVAAVVYAYFFFNYVKGNKDRFSFSALSDSVLTFFIGLFYVYAAIILSKPGLLYSENELMSNFTNNIDDVVTISFLNQTEQSFLPEDVELIMKSTTEYVVNFETYSTTEISQNPVEESTENVNPEALAQTQQEFVDTTEKQISDREVNKTDQFLANYQNFIKQFLKRKLNKTTIERENVFNFNPPQMNRKKRQSDLDENNENCFTKTFYEDALLIASFIHCLINVLKNTLYCKKCINNESDVNKEGNTEETLEENMKNENETGVIEVSTSKDDPVPVGPLFGEKLKSDSDLEYIPNIEIFQAKCHSKTQLFKQDYSENWLSTEGKYTYILQVLISWILPLVATILLYVFMSQEMPNNKANSTVQIVIPNFNTTRINSNIIHIMNHPNSSELDKIINNVYSVIDQVKKNSTNKPVPSTIDILHSMDHHKRVPKQKKTEMCPKITTFAIKLYYFFIYLAIFCGIIFYGKIIQTIAKVKNAEYSKQLNNSLISFSVMWLPSIVEVLLKTFFNSNKFQVLSDLFLLLGNSNQLYTMASNYFQCKRNNKCNLIKPEP